MRRFAQSALTISLAAAKLVACGGSQSPIGASGAMPQASALATHTGRSNYKVLHSFGNGSDGQSPEAALIAVNGTLYGTTYRGGTYGNGTVFALTP